MQEKHKKNYDFTIIFQEKQQKIANFTRILREKHQKFANLTIILLFPVSHSGGVSYQGILETIVSQTMIYQSLRQLHGLAAMPR